jgi:signal transduction histidine kinase
MSIEQQSTRLNQLTDNLLSLVRIEGGLDSSAMPTVDALDVLGSALVTARQFAPDRRITKDLQLGEAIVRADPSLLEQVLINVVQNAVVHTPPEAPIHVEVAAAPSKSRSRSRTGVLESAMKRVSSSSSAFTRRQYPDAAMPAPVSASRLPGALPGPLAAT